MSAPVATIQWPDRRPESVAAALDQLAIEANDLESREAFQRGAEAIRRPAVAPAPRGRKFIADEAALLEMARHNLKRRAGGLPDNDREAARIVSHRLAGNSRVAAADRLRRKFRKQRARFMDLVRWDLIDPPN
jgi:hypothetical protein